MGKSAGDCGASVSDAMRESTRELRLPAGLCRAAEEKFGKRFGNIEELLIFVLRELLREDAEQRDENESRIIEQRLRDLGYM